MSTVDALMKSAQRGADGESKALKALADQLADRLHKIDPSGEPHILIDAELPFVLVRIVHR
jgi:hypothetical protein